MLECPKCKVSLRALFAHLPTSYDTMQSTGFKFCPVCRDIYEAIAIKHETKEG